MENRNMIFAEIIEMLNNFIFEYTPSDDEMSFYVVADGKEVLARKIASFSKWKNTFPEQHVAKEDLATFEKMCEDVIAGNEVQTSFKTDFFTAGKFEEYFMAGKKHYQPDGSGTTFVGFITTKDKSGISEAKRNLGCEFVKDAGVDVYNKKSIFDYCKHFMEENPGKCFYIALFDLDNFKSVNDTFGHFYGDDVLNTVSEVFKDVVKDYGKVGRVGGDEFFVVFDKVDDRELLRSILKNARESVEATFKGKTGDFALTCSAGACSYPDCGSNFEQIYKVADALLYLAKEKGRNRYILFREDLHRELANRVITAAEEGKVEEVYEVVSGRWNHTTIIERVINDYYVSGKMGLDELLHIVENRFNADFIHIICEKKGIKLERKLTKTTEVDLVEPLAMNDGFLCEFKELNYFRANMSTNFKDPESGGRIFMKENKIQTALFYLMKEGDEVIGYLMFGKMHDNRKFAEQDSIVLTAIMQLISLKL